MSTVGQFNSKVTGWNRDAQRKMKNHILRMVLNIGPGYNQLKTSTRSYYGEVNRLQFNFPYYMVFVHKGAGRGYGGVKTGLFSRGDGSKGVTSRDSMGRMGTGKRVPKPWFNPVIEEKFPELADIITEYRGDQIALNIQRLLID